MGIQGKHSFARIHGGEKEEKEEEEEEWKNLGKWEFWSSGTNSFKPEYNSNSNNNAFDYQLWDRVKKKKVIHAIKRRFCLQKKIKLRKKLKFTYFVSKNRLYMLYIYCIVLYMYRNLCFFDHFTLVYSIHAEMKLSVLYLDTCTCIFLLITNFVRTRKNLSGLLLWWKKSIYMYIKYYCY